MMIMHPLNLVIASDHAGVDLKSHVAHMLMTHTEHMLVDLGPFSTDRVDYPDYARQACAHVLDGLSHRAILICGSGIGMSMAANRFTGIRCAVVTDPYMAELSRAHNNSNVISLGARVLGPDMAWRCVQAWLSTPFEGGRHEARLSLLDEQA